MRNCVALGSILALQYSRRCILAPATQNTARVSSWNEWWTPNGWERKVERASMTITKLLLSRPTSRPASLATRCSSPTCCDIPVVLPFPMSAHVRNISLSTEAPCAISNLRTMRKSQLAVCIALEQVLDVLRSLNPGTAID
jgi:hypothetical protein